MRFTLALGFVAALLAVNGCNEDDGGGDGRGGGGGDGGGAPSTASRVTALESVDDCPNGGSQVETGIDDNQNGLLDDAEVDEIVIVCNGENGQNGAPGTDAKTERPAPMAKTGRPASTGRTERPVPMAKTERRASMVKMVPTEPTPSRASMTSFPA